MQQHTLTRQQVHALQRRANAIQSVLRQNATLRADLRDALAQLAAARTERDEAREQAKKSATTAAATAAAAMPKTRRQQQKAAEVEA